MKQRGGWKEFLNNDDNGEKKINTELRELQSRERNWSEKCRNKKVRSERERGLRFDMKKSLPQIYMLLFVVKSEAKRWVKGVS